MNSLFRAVRALAARVCCGSTLERLIDPILADIELEHHVHLRGGRAWRARWVVLAGYFGLIHAISLHAMRAGASALILDEPASRTAWFSLGALVALALALTVPPLLGPHVDTVLAFYLLPQAIPVSMPFALAVGIGCGWSKGTTGRDMFRRVAILAALGAIVAAVTMEWVMPAANEGYRVTVIRRLAEAGRDTTMTRRGGMSERSLSEIAGLIRRTSHTRPFVASEYERTLLDLQEINAEMPRGRQVTRKDLQLLFHQRLALCFATVALGLLAVGTAAAVRRRSLARASFIGLVVLYVFAWFSGKLIVDVVPPVVSAEAPNLAAAATALVLLAVGSLRKDTRPSAA